VSTIEKTKDNDCISPPVKNNPPRQVTSVLHRLVEPRYPSPAAQMNKLPIHERMCTHSISLPDAAAPAFPGLRQIVHVLTATILPPRRLVESAVVLTSVILHGLSNITQPVTISITHRLLSHSYSTLSKSMPLCSGVHCCTCTASGANKSTIGRSR